MVLIVRQRGFRVPILSCDRDTPVSYKFSGRMCVCWGAYFRPPEEFLVGDIRDVSILRAGRDFFHSSWQPQYPAPSLVFSTCSVEV